MEVDNIVNNILLNTADNYPQAPPSGGTPRMREVITDVSRVDNPDNDFIYNSGLIIGDFIEIDKDDRIRSKGDDYTRFIMEVTNRIIGVTQDNSEDERERTIF